MKNELCQARTQRDNDHSYDFSALRLRKMSAPFSVILSYAELRGVTKSELIEKISENLKLPAGKAEAIVNTIFDSMVKALERGEGIEIRGFGSFTVRKYKSYEGRNPRSGIPVHVAEKRLPFFKVGKDLREKVNAGLGTPLPEDDPNEPDDTDPDDPDDIDDDDSD
jgi:integration host factor subunit beta